MAFARWLSCVILELLQLPVDVLLCRLQVIDHRRLGLRSRFFGLRVELFELRFRFADLRFDLVLESLQRRRSRATARRCGGHRISFRVWMSYLACSVPSTFVRSS
jgi:hypothetical protein